MCTHNYTLKINTLCKPCRLYSTMPVVYIKTSLLYLTCKYFAKMWTYCFSPIKDQKNIIRSHKCIFTVTLWFIRSMIDTILSTLVIFAFRTTWFVCFSSGVHWSSLNGTGYENHPANLRHISVTYFFRLYIFQNGVRPYVFFTLTRVRKWRLRFYPVVGRYLSFSRCRQQKQVYTTINNTCCDGRLFLSGYHDRRRRFPHHPETTLVTGSAARLGLVGTINREETWRKERQKTTLHTIKDLLGLVILHSQKTGLCELIENNVIFLKKYKFLFLFFTSWLCVLCSFKMSCSSKIDFADRFAMRILYCVNFLKRKIQIKGVEYILWYHNCWTTNGEIGLRIQYIKAKTLCRKGFLKIRSCCVLQMLYFILTGSIESRGRGNVFDQNHTMSVFSRDTFS